MNNSRDEKIKILVLTAMMMCLILVSTYFFKVPTIATKGYVHLGDAAIFLAVMILGKRNGAIAAGIGSCLSDLLGGYAYYAPWTLAVKFLMALVTGLFLDYAAKRSAQKKNPRNVLSVFEIFGMIVGGFVMVAGYAVAARVMYQSWAVAFASVPENIGQFGVGIVISLVVATALHRTPVRRYFQSTSMSYGRAD